MITKILWHLQLAAIFMAACVFGVAAQDVPILHRLNVGQSMVVAPDKEATRFAVGDENVASVEILSPVEFLLTGKKTGRTNVILWFLDGGREERIIVVEEDLEPLRRRLNEIDSEIRIESSANGEIILTGSVETYEVMRTVVQLASDYVRGSKLPEIDDLAVVRDETPTANGEPAPPTLRRIDETRSGVKIRNLLVVRNIPQSTLLDRLEAEAAKYSDDISVERLSEAPYPDDKFDSFVVKGTIQSQGSYTQMLTVLDRILGGTGKFKSVTDSGGGTIALIKNNESSSQSGGGSTGVLGGSGNTDLSNNIEANPGRASIVLSENERIISFVKVLDFPQVIVGVRVLEINRTKVKEVGVDWALALGHDGDFTAPATFAGGILPSAIGANAINESLLPNDRNVSTVTDGLFTNSLTIVEDQFVLNSTVHMLEGKGFLRTLSEPNLVTLSGETATFLVGGQFPVRQVGSTNQTVIEDVDFLEFGIRLSIRPVVAEDGMITLDVSPAISSVTEVTESGNPILDVTSLTTSVKLQDGEGMILGGLIMNDEREEKNQVPWLGDVPYLGRLFQRKTKSGGERELALILVPKIANPQPRENFALQPPDLDYEIRPGTYVEPELGKLPELPKFINTNLGTGERITINVEDLPEVEPSHDGTQPEMIETPAEGTETSGATTTTDGDVLLVVPAGSNP